MSDIILIIIILIIASGLLRRLLFFGLRKYFQKVARDLSNINQQPRNESNQKTFWSNNKPNSRSNNDTGEYIDYEEIK